MITRTGQPITVVPSRFIMGFAWTFLASFQFAFNLGKIIWKIPDDFAVWTAAVWGTITIVYLGSIYRGLLGIRYEVQPAQVERAQKRARRLAMRIFALALLCFCWGLTLVSMKRLGGACTWASVALGALVTLGIFLSWRETKRFTSDLAQSFQHW